MIFLFKNKTKNILQDMRKILSQKHFSNPLCIGTNEEFEAQTFNKEIFHSKMENISIGLFLNKKNLSHSLGYAFLCASVALKEQLPDSRTIGFKWPSLILENNGEIGNISAIKTNLGIMLCIRLFISSFPNNKNQFQSFLKCCNLPTQNIVTKHPMLFVQKIAKNIEKLFYVEKYSKEYFNNLHLYKLSQQIHNDYIKIALPDIQIKCYFRDIDDDCNGIFYIPTMKSSSSLNTISVPDSVQTIGYQEITKINFL